MNKLYETNVDENRWKVIEISNKCFHTYRIVDKENDNTYFLNNVIGVEQVTDDEFLVYKKYNWDEYIIERFKFENSKRIKMFERKFNHFEFITDDRILFLYCDRSARYRNQGIYSISENKEVEAEWLRGAIIDTYKTEDDKVGMFVDMNISSYKLGDVDLLFTVDPETLEPNSECYSTLRDSYIKVESKEDIINLRKEENKYVRIITDIMSEQDRNNYQNAKKRILNKNA